MGIAPTTQERNALWLTGHVEHCVRDGAPNDWAESMFADGDAICQAIEVRSELDGRLLLRMRLVLGRGDIQLGRFKPCRQVLDVPSGLLVKPAPAKTLLNHQSRRR